MNTRAENPKGVGTQADIGPAGSSHRRNTLTAALLQTREVRQTLDSTLPEVLRAWAGESKQRTILADLAGRGVRRGFAPPRNGDGAPPLDAVLRRPEHARALGAQLPAWIKALLDASAAVSEGVASLPREDQARLVGEMLEGLDPGRAGKLLTGVARIVSEAEAAAPGSVAERLRPGVRRWVREVDFGELRETGNTFAENAAAMAAMVNEEMWQYPAKMVCLLSLLPSSFNAATRALTRSVEPVNRMAPDLLADVLLSLLREARGEDIAPLVNELCELARQVHTGSVLIGEHGEPQLPADLAALIGDVLRSLDLGLLFRAASLLAETGESTANAFCYIDHYTQNLRLWLMLDELGIGYIGTILSKNWASNAPYVRAFDKQQAAYRIDTADLDSLLVGVAALNSRMPMVKSIRGPYDAPDMWLEDTLSLAMMYRADFIVYNGTPGCRKTWGMLKSFARDTEKAGFPTHIMYADAFDERVQSWEATRERFEEFITVRRLLP